MSLAKQVAYVSTGLLRQIAWTSIIYGVLIASFATLLGTGQRVTAVRRAITPAFVSPVTVAGGTAMLLLLLLWWSPGRSFATWTTGLVLIALIVGAVVSLRRVLLAEDARSDSQPA